MGTEGKVSFASNGGIAVNLPFVTETRHFRIVRGNFESRMVASESNYEVALVWTRVPDTESKAASLLTQTREDIGGRGKLGAH